MIQNGSLTLRPRISKPIRPKISTSPLKSKKLKTRLEGPILTRKVNKQSSLSKMRSPRWRMMMSCYSTKRSLSGAVLVSKMPAMIISLKNIRFRRSFQKKTISVTSTKKLSMGVTTYATSPWCSQSNSSAATFRE